MEHNACNWQMPGTAQAKRRGTVKKMVFASMVGARVKRKEDPHLITGNGTYVANLALPNMAYVAFVRSPYAHARIRGIDTTAARQYPGVVAVVTGQDVLTDYEPLPIMGSAEAAKKHSHYALSVERVRYAGEIVAAVIATSPTDAADAAAEVVVDWEPLPAVAHYEKAIESGAPKVFEDMPDNVEHTWKRKTGDVDGAFAHAFRVVKQRMVSQRLAGVPMEGRAVVAAPDPITGGVTLWTSTQATHKIRTEI